MVVAAELAVGVPGDPRQQQVALDLGGPLRLLEKRLGQTAGPPHQRSPDDSFGELKHRSTPTREKHGTGGPPMRLF